MRALTGKRKVHHGSEQLLRLLATGATQSGSPIVQAPTLLPQSRRSGARRKRRHVEHYGTTVSATSIQVRLRLPEAKRMLTVQRLTAFTTNPAGGNPAGVVIGSRLPPEDEMQRTAAQVGYSETAFLAPIPEEHRSYRVRYFSPLMEVPFCGHATIAAGVSLAQRDGPGRLRLVTNAGPVTVDAEYDGAGQLFATLSSPRPSVDPVDDRVVSEVLAALDWSSSDLHHRLPPARASAGASHLILGVRHRARLAQLEYDFDRLRGLMMQAGLVTLHLVWQEGTLRYHARDPFPVGGVVEDPATGAAAAAFGAYLRHFALVAPPCRITILQGEDMGRPSTLLVDLIPGQQSVRVTGYAVPLP